MAIVVRVTKNTYTAEPLCQWDLDRALKVYGLTLTKVPEVHFCHKGMSRAIVRQATMDAAGVVRVKIPNSLLQKPYPVLANICTYEGSTFKTLYRLEIPVKPRSKPCDYTLNDDPEVYSFNALENAVVNALASMDASVAAMQKTVDNVVTSCQDAAEESAEKIVDRAMEELKEYAVSKSCQALSADVGKDGADLLTITCRGHIGVTESEAGAGIPTSDGTAKTGTTTASITIDLNKAPRGARVGFVGGFGAVAEKYNVISKAAGSGNEINVTAVATLNGTEIWSKTFESGPLTGGGVQPKMPDLSPLNFNWAAVVGRPLTNGDVLTVTLTTAWKANYASTYQYWAYADVTQDGVFVRYLEV